MNPGISTLISPEEEPIVKHFKRSRTKEARAFWKFVDRVTDKVLRQVTPPLPPRRKAKP